MILSQPTIAFTSIKSDARKALSDSQKIESQELNREEKGKLKHQEEINAVARKIHALGLSTSEENEIIWSSGEAYTRLPVHWFTKDPNVKFLKKHFSFNEIELMLPFEGLRPLLLDALQLLKRNSREDTFTHKDTTNKIPSKYNGHSAY